MTTIGVIPARYASTRFPAKVLAKIAGRPMIQHVWDKVQLCREVDLSLIACDHEEVFKAARDFGARVVMTDPLHPSGSDRIAEAIKDLDVDVVINIQGDEPFIDPETIDALARLLKSDTATVMGTVIKEIHDEADFQNPNVVKCVIDEKGHALYFSRAPIPCNRNIQKRSGIKGYKHLGIYAYTKDFLMQYQQWPKGRLESIEQLEQLRVLERGHKIKTTLTTYESIAVDTPEDLQKAQQFVSEQRIT